VKNSAFTLVYSKDHQYRFDRALSENRLDSAEEELKKIPLAKNMLEEMKRITVLAQGYRALAAARRDLLSHLLLEYRSLGTISQIKVDQHLLKEYRSLGNLEYLRDQATKLAEFEESAKKTR